MKPVRTFSLVVLLVLLISALAACGTGRGYVEGPLSSEQRAAVNTSIAEVGTGVPGAVAGQPMSGGTPVPRSASGQLPVDPTALTRSEFDQANTRPATPPAPTVTPTVAPTSTPTE
jgi:hypothetical protein